MSERDDSLDLFWEPASDRADVFRAEYMIDVSPAPGAHLKIDLPLPGPCQVKIIIDKERAKP